MRMIEDNMTEKVNVELGDRSYDILIGTRLIDSLGMRLSTAINGGKILLVCDSAVLSPWGKKVFRELSEAGYDMAIFEVPQGEKSKSSELVMKMWDTMAEGDFARDCALLALGGGVVGDLAGFAAATFLRGIDFVQIPTTLLAMVDSSVGGKTGINLPQGKNLVGSFWQPRLVVADLDLLKSLPEGERISGLAEVIKYGVIYDAEFFGFLEATIDTLFDPARSDDLKHAIRRSVEIKADVVTKDERESGLRRILNFGHTIGHAIEAEAHYGDLRHGECVAIGMVAVSLLAQRRRHGSWDEDDHTRLVALIEQAGLPTRLEEPLSAEALIDRTRVDKKVKGGKVRYILPTRIGHVESVRDITDAEVREVLLELGAQ